jgi:hypothetical protein
MQVLKSAAPVHSDVVKSAPVQLDIETLNQVAGGAVPTPGDPTWLVTPTDPTW